MSRITFDSKRVAVWLSSNITRSPVQPRTPDDGYMLTEASSEVQTITF